MSINNLKIQRVTRELDLGEYQPEYAGQSLTVWVNPPVRVRNEMYGLLNNWRKAIAAAMLVENPLRYHQEYKIPLPEDGDQIKKGTPEEIEAAQEAAREARAKYWAWFAQVWEGDSEEDVLALAEKLSEQEPGLWDYLRTKTIKMIGEYADARKKA